MLHLCIIQCTYWTRLSDSWIPPRTRHHSIMVNYLFGPQEKYVGEELSEGFHSLAVASNNICGDFDWLTYP